VSYTRSAGSPPDSAIWRIGTRTPRAPSTNTFRELGNASSSELAVMVGADMAALLPAVEERSGDTDGAVRIAALPPPV
jgi:hypothetical protein